MFFLPAIRLWINALLAVPFAYREPHFFTRDLRVHRVTSRLILGRYGRAPSLLPCLQERVENPQSTIRRASRGGQGDPGPLPVLPGDQVAVSVRPRLLRCQRVCLPCRSHKGMGMSENRFDRDLGRALLSGNQGPDGRVERLFWWRWRRLCLSFRDLCL